MHRAFNLGWLERLARHHKMKMNPGENLGVFGCAFGVDFQHAVSHIRA